MDDPGGAPDRELIAAVRQGDVSAFEVLYRRYLPVVRRVVGDAVTDLGLIDDAALDAFVEAMEQLPTLRDPDGFQPWLKAMARNAASDVGEADPEMLAAEEATQAEQSDMRELVRLVTGAFTQLSPRDLHAVALAGYLDASPDEIAKRLGITAEATNVILRRAHGRLRDALKLELLVRQAGSACAELVALVNASKLTVAGQHLASCASCEQTGSAQTRRYDAAMPTPPTASITIAGPEGTSTVPLAEQLTIGRALEDVTHGQTLIVDGDAVSRHHAEIHVTGSAAMFVDTSSNGSMINDNLITRESVLLHDGDVITIRSTVLTFHAGAPATPPPDLHVGPVVVAAAVDPESLTSADGVRDALRPMARLYDGRLVEDAIGRLITSFGHHADEADERAGNFAEDATALITELTRSASPQDGWTVTLDG